MASFPVQKTGGKTQLLPRARLFENKKFYELAAKCERSKLSFFMTSLHKHVLAAMGCRFVISTLVVELSLMAGCLNTARPGEQSTQKSIPSV